MGARVDTRMRSGASMIVVGTVKCCTVDRRSKSELHLRPNSALIIFALQLLFGMLYNQQHIEAAGVLWFLEHFQ